MNTNSSSSSHLKLCRVKFEPACLEAPPVVLTESEKRILTAISIPVYTSHARLEVGMYSKYLLLKLLFLQQLLGLLCFFNIPELSPAGERAAELNHLLKTNTSLKCVSVLAEID